jgi:hypothetical protein
MAQWKKLLVSGSNVSQLANDAGYITGLPSGLVSSSAQITMGGDLTGNAGNAQIAAGAVGTTELAAGAVTAAKLDGAIGLISSSAQLTDVVKTSGTQTIGGDKTFSNNVTISGDLTINGETTTISTTNLKVEDKFIALATGTTSGGSNGGIIVVSGSITGTEVGYGFAFNSNIQRWGFSKGTAVTTNGATVSAWTVGTTFSPTSGAPAAAPSYGGVNNGVGNLHVDTATGDVYIYVESGQSSGGTPPEADAPQGPGL